MTLIALFQSGDRIAVDRLTYPGLKSVAASLGIRLVPVSMDGDGMLPEALKAACRREAIQGLYLMPCVQNPTTTCMPEGRRDEIAAVALTEGLLLIEDDAYALTGGAGLLPLSMRMQENSVSICGISKAFAAGLRIAFIVTAKHLVHTIARAILNTIWMAPTLNAALTSRWIIDGTADKILVAKNHEAAMRNNLAHEVLAPFPCHSAPAGHFIWLPLPAPWAGRQFEIKAREAGVNLFSAEKFIVGAEAAPPTVRLSLSAAESQKELKQALVIVRGLLEKTPD